MRFTAWRVLFVVLPIFLLAGCGSSGSKSSGSGQPTLQSITVISAVSSVSIGGTAQFSATGNYSDGTSHLLGSGVTWSSSSASLVSVNAMGLATGVAPGTALITATKSSTSGSGSLGVNNALVSIAVTGTSSMAYQQSVQLTATGTYQTGSTQNLTSAVTWASNNSSIVSVSATGLATAVKGGNATISATDSSGKIHGSLPVTVGVTLSSISITPASPNLNYIPGSTYQFTATGVYQDGTTQDLTSTATWSSSLPTVATISNTGLASLVKGGQTMILAGSGGISGSATLTITAALTGITVNPPSASVDPTIGQQFTATGNYNDGSTQDLTASATWTTSNISVATISSGGVATGVAAGTANVKASFGGQFGQVILTVNSPVSLTVTPASTSVEVGKTVQFKAAANYSDGFSLDVTSSANWTTSATSVATVNSTGLATGVAAGSANVKATFASNFGQAALTVTTAPQIVSMSITPIGPGVLVAGKQQFTATAKLSDGSTQDVTASSTWTSSDTSKVSVTNDALATGVANGAVTVTATSAGVSGNTAMNVVSSAYAPLKGDYAFTLTSVETRGPAYFMGSITADGSGHITAGVEDANESTGVLTDVTVSGSYFMYPDGRGTITINPNAIHPNGIALRFALSSNASHGRLMEFDGNGTIKGTLEAQSTGAFGTPGINGNYVFRMSGTDVGSNPMAQVGVISTDGVGNISSGTMDTNDFGTLTAATALSPSSYAMGSSGRGTMSIAGSQYVVYIVDSTRFNLIQIDNAPATALAGVAELQANQTFTVASLNGGYVFLLEQPVVVGTAGGQDRSEFNKIGQWAFDGKGSLQGTEDDDNNYSKNPVTGVTGSYAVGALNKINGRGTINTSTSAGSRSYVLYLVSPSKMYLMETYLGASTSSINAPVGVAELQTGTGSFGQNTLTGSYTLAASEIAEQDSQTLMQLVFAGSGGVSGIADLSVNGAISAVVMNASYTGAPIDPNLGRAAVSVTNAVGANNYVFYLLDSSRAWLLGITPDSDGAISQQ